MLWNKFNFSYCIYIKKTKEKQQKNALIDLISAIFIIPSIVIVVNHLVCKIRSRTTTRKHFSLLGFSNATKIIIIRHPDSVRCVALRWFRHAVHPFSSSSIHISIISSSNINKYSAVNLLPQLNLEVTDATCVRKSDHMYRNSRYSTEICKLCTWTDRFPMFRGKFTGMRTEGSFLLSAVESIEQIFDE